MKKLFTLSLWAFGPVALFSQTWAVDVAPILFDKCAKCHNDQGIAPFPLISYDDAFNNMAAVKEAVMQKTMPPWPPQEGYGQFAHPRTLSQQQIQTIANWVDNGGQSGNLADAPPAPVFDNGFEIQNPDLVVQMPSYTVNTDFDLYRCFVIPAGITSEKFIQEIEVVPGNKAIVHHVLVFQDNSQTPLNLDAQDPGPGYTSFGGTGSNNSDLIGAWVPGTMKFRAPNGMGIKLDANTNLILQIHYPGGTYNQTDSTQVRIKYSTSGGSVREVTIAPAINHGNTLTNGPLLIPANQTKTFYAQYTVPQQANVSLLLAGPHMHLIGRSIKAYGVTPSNDTIPFINIPHWDFHWQGFYPYKTLVKVPGGTVIKAEAFYDNTTGNPHNPSNPPQTVTAGEATNDEMMMVYFGYTLYFPGDEFISQELDGSGVEEFPNGIVSSMQWYDMYPNPAQEQVTVAGFLPSSANMYIRITDMNGKVLLQNRKAAVPAGHYTHTIELNGLAAGSYIMQLYDGKTVRAKTLIKN